VNRSGWYWAPAAHTKQAVRISGVNQWPRSARQSRGSLTVEGADQEEILDAPMEGTLDPLLGRLDALVDGPVELGLDEANSEIVDRKAVDGEAAVGRQVGLECVEAVITEDGLASHDAVHHQNPVGARPRDLPSRVYSVRSGSKLAPNDSGEVCGTEGRGRVVGRRVDGGRTAMRRVLTDHTEPSAFSTALSHSASSSSVSRSSVQQRRHFWSRCRKGPSPFGSYSDVSWI
jgi:hypothetical protein